MHEFPEVQAMVQKACAEAPRRARVRRITIAVGEASGHDLRHIVEHFGEASRGTMAEGAELQFIWEKLAARCAACGATFESSDLALKCARCGGVELVITAGKDVRLIEVQT